MKTRAHNIGVSVYIVIKEFNDYGYIHTSIAGVFDNKEYAEKLCNVINENQPNSRTQCVNSYVFETYLGWGSEFEVEL